MVQRFRLMAIPMLLVALGAPAMGQADGDGADAPEQPEETTPGETVTTPKLVLEYEVKPPLPAPPPRGPLPSLEEQETAANLLDHLERRDEDLSRLTAEVQYTRFQSLQGDTQTRIGMLYYLRHAPGAGGAEGGGRVEREFAVDFTRLIVDQRVREERTMWVFDGEWLVEKDYQTRQFIRRRIAAPGADIDPLRLGSGSGTIPLPIGQRREDVERFFVPELVGALDGLVPGPDDLDDTDAAFRDFVRRMGSDRGVEGVHQLKLTPREGTEAAEDYRVIRLWYQKGSLLPMMSRAIDRKGDISTVQLAKVNTEAEIPAGVTSTEPPARDEGWDIREEDRLFE